MATLHFVPSAPVRLRELKAELKQVSKQPRLKIDGASSPADIHLAGYNLGKKDLAKSILKKLS